MSANGAWNLTIDDSSPMVIYLPHVNNDPGSTWATYNLFSGFYGNDGETLLANSSHVTWNDRSSIQLGFFGSAIYLYGEANCTYDITIDKAKQPLSSPNGSLLASFTGLTPGEHVLLLKPSPGGSSNTGFAFDKALVTMQSRSGEADRDIYNSRNSSISYTGSWQELSNSSVPSISTPAPYRQSKMGSWATLDFYGDSVMVEGPLGWEVSQYGIVLDENYYHYNGSSGAVVGNTVLFYATGLDPDKSHIISLENRMGSSESIVGLNSITVFGSQGRQPNRSEYTKKVKIIPILASVLVVVILLQILAAVIYVRRRRQRQRRGTPEPEPESEKV